jgi:hypothetical protein
MFKDYPFMVSDKTGEKTLLGVKLQALEFTVQTRAKRK